MTLSPQSVQSAKQLTLPDTEEIQFMTAYDRRIWQQAFDWYNKTYSPEHTFTLSCRHCYSKVFTALKEAQKV